MSSVRVVRTTAGRDYPVRVERTLQPALGEVLAGLGEVSRVFVVTDANVADLHLEAARVGLDVAGVITLEPGEGSKSHAVLERVWTSLREARCDRRSLVLALGGGVVGDLAGFAASTFMRGVRVLHLPTTLLAMVDSAIGGKTAINLGVKNLIGTFHAPVGVVADLSVLSTLPPEEVRCGFGEVWKTGILVGEPLLGRLESDAAKLVSLDLDALEPVVAACADYKAGVVERDERESGERALLNHGEAVVVGGVFACRLAEGLGWLEPEVTARFRALAEALGLPTQPARVPSPDALLKLIAGDKKTLSGQMRWVLPRGPGRCEVTAEVTEARVREALAASG